MFFLGAGFAFFNIYISLPPNPDLAVLLNTRGNGPEAKSQILASGQVSMKSYIPFDQIKK